jgi:hypothetical protein
LDKTFVAQPGHSQNRRVGETFTLSLHLNFSALTFGDVDVEAQILPYRDDGPEFLKQLRQDHWRTHVFRRDGASTLLGIPVTADAPDLSDEKRTIRLKDNLSIAAVLARNGFLSYLSSLQRPALKYDPIQFLARDEFLHSCLPAGLSRPSWMTVRLLYEVAIRPIYFQKRKPFLAAAVNIRTVRRADRTVSDLITDGFRPEGFYVVRPKQALPDTRIEPGIELLGRVVKVVGNTLELEDSREGVVSVASNEVLLERNAFDSLLDHYFPSHMAGIKDKLEAIRADLRSGPNKLKRIGTFIEHFTTNPLRVTPELAVTFSRLLTSDDSSFPNLDNAPKPVYVFDQSATKTSPWHDGGLDRHGPYTAKVFTPTRPHLCVVCQRTHKGRVEEFIHKFVNGISSAGTGSSRNYFEKGLLRKYLLQDVTYEFFFAESPSASAYKAACVSALEKHSASKKFDLALIQIEESFHDLPIGVNPYFVTKESFLTHQIPVQEFEIETAQKPDKSLAFCLNNMALATYAKLNGIPWLLKGNPTIAHELVIGLGSAQINEKRLGSHERFVGITTVFSGDGNYHLSSASKAVPFAGYAQAFKEALRNTIQKVRVDMNWRPKDHVRLIFHASFKKFSHSETDTVRDIVGELTQYEVEYAFVEISEEHPFLLFDDKAAGKQDFETRSIKGVYAPPRATMLQLSNRETLLCLTGPGEVKRPQDGLPSPLLLSLHRTSTFADMTYISRQAFAFSCHLWRTFLPASMPVTIQYSDLIARALGSLAQFERWNPDVMIGKIGKTRWFL